MQVLHSKVLAKYAVPESCAVHCEVQREALTGVRAGQPLSREMVISQGAHAVNEVEGNTTVSAIASTRTTRRGLRPWHVRTLLAREPGDLQLDRRRLCRPAARIGKARSQSQ